MLNKEQARLLLLSIFDSAQRCTKAHLGWLANQTGEAVDRYMSGRNKPTPDRLSYMIDKLRKQVPDLVLIYQDEGEVAYVLHPRNLLSWDGTTARVMAHEVGDRTLFMIVRDVEIVGEHNAGAIAKLNERAREWAAFSNEDC